MLFDKGDGFDQNTYYVYMIFLKNNKEVIKHPTHLILERTPSP